MAEKGIDNSKTKPPFLTRSIIDKASELIKTTLLEKEVERILSDIFENENENITNGPIHCYESDDVLN